MAQIRGTEIGGSTNKLSTPARDTSSEVDPYGVQESGETGAVIAPVATLPTPGNYTIQPGDTFYGIARKLGVDVNQIIKANAGVDPTQLQVGQVINMAYPVANVTPEQEAARRGQTTPLRDLEQPNVPDPYDVQGSGGGTPGGAGTGNLPTTPTTPESPNNGGGYTGGGGTNTGGGGGGGGTTGPGTDYKGIDVGGGIFKTGDQIIADLSNTTFEWDPATDKNYLFAQSQMILSMKNSFSASGMLYSSLTEQAIQTGTAGLQAEYYELAYQKYADNRDFQLSLAELAYSREDREWDEQFQLMQFQADQEEREFQRGMALRNEARQEASLQLQRDMAKAQQENQNRSVELAYRSEKYGKDFEEYTGALDAWKSNGTATQEVVDIINRYGGSVRIGQSYSAWDADDAIMGSDDYFEIENNALRDLSFQVGDADYAIGSLYNYLKPQEEIDYENAPPETLGGPSETYLYRSLQQRFMEATTPQEASSILSEITMNAELQDSLGYDLFVSLTQWAANDYIPNWSKYHPSANKNRNFTPQTELN